MLDIIFMNFFIRCIKYDILMVQWLKLYIREKENDQITFKDEMAVLNISQ